MFFRIIFDIINGFWNIFLFTGVKFEKPLSDRKPHGG